MNVDEMVAWLEEQIADDKRWQAFFGGGGSLPFPPERLAAIAARLRELEDGNEFLTFCLTKQNTELSTLHDAVREMRRLQQMTVYDNCINPQDEERAIAEARVDELLEGTG